MINKISNWQDQRFLWVLMIIASAGLVIVAHSFFQNYLYMPPCEQCVYIRFAFFCMTLGGIIACINPKNSVLKLIAYVFSFWGAIQGIMYSIKLSKIHTAVHGDDPFGVQGCSAEPHYPFGLPLHQWAPDWFLPTGDCGYDNPVVPDDVSLNAFQQFFVDMYSEGWYLVPSQKLFSMADCCLFAFGVCFVILAVMLLSWLITKFKPATI